jgi:hypothetical protein
VKNQILEIIKQYPKRYSQIIKKDPTLHQWVTDNTKVNNLSFAASIYSAITQTSNICPNGNRKQFRGFEHGWLFCGHANLCKCNKDESAMKTSKSKSNNSNETNQLINIKRSTTMQSKYGVEYN